MMSKNQQQIRSAFHHAAHRYDAHADQQRDVLAKLVALSQTHVQSASLVLDVGCGTGALANLVDWPLLGIDAAHGMCRVANVQRGMRVAVADMSQLPFADASMPALISSLSLQWSSDKARTLAEWQRVLCGGGTVAFSVYLQSTLNELSESFKAIGLPSPVQVFVSHEELLEMINHAGLSLRATECSTLIMSHTTLISLLKYLKLIGASTPSSPRGSLRGRQQLARLEAAYRERSPASITSYWEVGYYVLQKPA